VHLLQRHPSTIDDEQHAAIVKAIVARDHDAARAAANLHLSFIQASLREIGVPAKKRVRRKA
jgi:DNA-binding FadR family transcriptional regulator